MAIPTKYSGREIEIVVDSKILTDEDFLLNAANSALNQMAEAIKLDVIETNRDVFADKPGEWSFPKGGYRDAVSYYNSGKVPYWRGGLIGSFDVIGSDEPYSYSLGFTSPYAELIESGGSISNPPPKEWYSDKEIPVSKVSRVHAHPYLESVTYKISENLVHFGYLDVFAKEFTEFIR